MPRRPVKVPSYCRHKHSGQAVVRISGRDQYLGSYGSPESHARYVELVAHWRVENNSAAGVEFRQPTGDLSINELILAYWRYAQRRYVKSGKPTDEQHGLRAALRPLRRMFGQTGAAAFGPKSLKQVRQAMVQSGHSRKYINGNVDRIRRVFKWAVSEELVAVTVYDALRTVSGLRAGESDAKETIPITPVPESHMRAVLPLVTQQVAAMIELQHLTGARPGEIAAIRPCDVSDHDGAVSVYQPESHKSQYRGRERRIFIGPRAQTILLPWLNRPPSSYCFSPKEAVAERRTARSVGTNRRPGTHYRVDSYRTAVRRACLKAGVPVWTPNQLRHSRATLVRERYGIEAAQTVLGHSEAGVTQIYAERDYRLAAKIMHEMG